MKKKIAFFNMKGGTGVTSDAIVFTNKLQSYGINSILVFKEHDDCINFPKLPEAKNPVTYNDYVGNQEQYKDKVVVFDLSGLFRGEYNNQQKILEDCDYVVSVGNSPTYLNNNASTLGMMLELDSEDRKRATSLIAINITDRKLLDIFKKEQIH